MEFILASTSPRRKELLGIIVPRFECAAPQFDEGQIDIKNAREKALVLSREKCKDVVSRTDKKDAVIIASDTVVDLGGQILEKPQDMADAYIMIKSLSDNKHKVHTAVTVYCRGIYYTFADTTEVYVDKIPEKAIMDYIITDEPYDKAGGYAIQGFMGGYISRINGNYHNVVGLPLAKLNKLLKNIKVL